MSRRTSSFLPRITSHSAKPATLHLLITYAFTVFLLRFADATMSYISPVFIQARLKESWQMGLIIATSSMVGLLCDLIFGELFRNKRFSFFLFWGLLCAFGFPLSYLLLPPVVPIFILSMAIWGVYFELFRFADFSFINRFVTREYHAISWGVLYAFMAASYMIAPATTSYLLELNPNLPFYTAILALATAFGLFLLLISFSPKNHFHPDPSSKHALNLIHELKLWQLLIPKLWSVLLFSFSLTILDAIFWTSGSILSEQFKSSGLPGGLIFFAYLSPALFMGSLAGKIAEPYGKKKAAFSSGLLSGVFFTISGLATSPLYFIIAIFLGSTFAAIATPEINGTVEDYIERLGHSANSMVGLEGSMSSLAYIFGPILAGVIATLSHHQLNFTFMGLILIIVSLISLLVTPRKIHLPQQAIHRLEDALKTT